MIPLPTREKKNSSPFPPRVIWSPTQEMLESPCTKLIKNRQNDIRTRALLDKFIAIRMKEAETEENKQKEKKTDL